jgi:hypothetical protein
MKSIFLTLAIALTIFSFTSKVSSAELITNGGFENAAAFTGWTVVTAGSGWYPWQNTAAGAGDSQFGIAVSAPLFGTRDAWTGFCCTPAPEYIEQTITIPAAQTARIVWYDKIQSNLWEFCTSANCGTNTWRVQVLNTSNTVLQTLRTVTSAWSSTSTNLNTGWRGHSDSLTAYAGQTIKIRFSATYVSGIGGNINGPGRAEVDGVSVTSPVVPTAANVTVSGRVTTSEGYGISRAIISLTNAAGVSRSALTNQFGYYKFDEVEVGQTYTVAVNSKKYFFANNPRIVSVTDELTNLDFSASP